MPVPAARTLIARRFQCAPVLFSSKMARCGWTVPRHVSGSTGPSSSRTLTDDARRSVSGYLRSTFGGQVSRLFELLLWLVVEHRFSGPIGLAGCLEFASFVLT